MHWIISNIINIFGFKIASAHEIYVLSPNIFSSELEVKGINFFAVVTDPKHFLLIFTISISVIAVFVISYFFGKSQLGERIDTALKAKTSVGLLFMRVMLASVFFYSAYSHAFLGPEISTTGLHWQWLIEFLLYLFGFAFLFGILVEYFALFATILFFTFFAVAGVKLNSYVYYLGEFAALFIFGSRVFSLDQKFFKEKSTKKWQDFEATIVRVFFGIGLLYAALYAKIIHSALALEVVKEYNLTQYHLFFPSDQSLVVAGAAIVESLIALCIIFGIRLRLVISVLLFYLTLSLFFFGEAVWPHLMLYGISIFLLVAGPGRWSFDEKFVKHIQKPTA